MVIYIQLSWPFNILMQNRIEFTQFIEKINIDIKFFIKLVYFALIYFINQFNDYCIGALVLIQNFWDSLKQSICKPRHWNLAIGIGIGNGIGIGTDITNAIIFSSISSIIFSSPNLAGWSLRIRGPHPQIHVTLRYRCHVTSKKNAISTLSQGLWTPHFAGQ